MSATGFLRVKKLLGSGIILAAARHNKRAIQEEIGACQNIDPTRTRLNVSLLGEQRPEDINADAASRMAGAGITNMRKNGVRCIELVFSLPVGTHIDPVDYFNACLDWTVGWFKVHVLSADIHLDEAAPHCHILLLPLDANGRMNGSDIVGYKARIADMHRNFYESVAKKHGLPKPSSRLSGYTRAEMVKQVLKRLNGSSDSALTSVLWPQIRSSIEAEPLPFAEAFGIVVAEKPKKRKTFVQIMTSKGKGSQHREQEGHREVNTNPIGNSSVDHKNPLGNFNAEPTEPYRELQHSLSCVGNSISGDRNSAAIARKAAKQLFKLPTGLDDSRIVCAAHDGGVSIADISRWLGDGVRATELLETSPPTPWRYLYEVETKRPGQDYPL